MSAKPIFVATHPRSCSTAFERVFMTRHETLKCIHEPFGDAFYYGPERLSSRFENDEKGRLDSGFERTTFRTVLDRIEREAAEGRRLFIKDIIHYLVPPNAGPPSIAPSLVRKRRGIGTIENSTTNDIGKCNEGPPYPFGTESEPGNPTVIPLEHLAKFHFTFLIRHPRYSIPSYFRCTVPPLDQITGFYNFMPSEAGYDETRRVFEYLRSVGQIGPHMATERGGGSDESDRIVSKNETDISGRIEICVVDADDLLDNPKEVVKAYCKSVGIEFDESMLNWKSEEDHQQAKEAFGKWQGFHDDAMNSNDLKPRQLHKKKQPKDRESENNEWREKFGERGARVIRETVDANVKDYEFLRQFALKIAD